MQTEGQPHSLRFHSRLRADGYLRYANPRKAVGLLKEADRLGERLEHSR